MTYSKSVQSGIYTLNSNIRCIEIWVNMVIYVRLKQLNSNIRCIEIHRLSAELTGKFPLNSNIRCIEMDIH